jgi:hypothetical protein
MRWCARVRVEGGGRLQYSSYPVGVGHQAGRYFALPTDVAHEVDSWEWLLSRTQPIGKGLDVSRRWSERMKR